MKNQCSDCLFSGIIGVKGIMDLGDIRSKKLIIAKGGLFLILGLFAGVFIVIGAELWWERLGLLAICVWAFCRAYYFAFYVITHYVDSEYKFDGICSAVRYLIRRRKK